MSDYYYLNEDADFNPILGEDYISALYSISKKHGINITDEMVLKEVWGKQFQTKQLKVVAIKKPRMINIRGK